MLSYGIMTMVFLFTSIAVFNIGAVVLKVIFPKQNYSWAIMFVGFIIESIILRIAVGGPKKMIVGNIPNNDAFFLVIVTFATIVAIGVVQKIGNRSKKSEKKSK